MDLQKKAERILRRLLRVRPLIRHPVEIVWKEISGCAEVTFDAKRQVAVIYLSPSRITTRYELLDSMIHEVAHIRVMGTTVPHGSAWGIDVGRLWKAWGVDMAKLYRAYHRTR